jgi:hypothetical protein
VANRTDTFLRADGAIGTPSDGGSAWQQLSGTWVVASNQAAETSGAGQCVCVLESGTPDADVQATAGGTLTDAGLVLRASGNSDYLLFQFGSGGSQIFRRTAAGGFVSLAVGPAVAAGSVVTFHAKGTTVSAFDDGVQTMSVAESSGQANTLHGLRANDLTCRYANFTITDLTPAPTNRGDLSSPVGLGSLSQRWRGTSQHPKFQSDNRLFLAIQDFTLESVAAGGLAGRTADSAAALGALTSAATVTHPVTADSAAPLGTLTESAAAGVAVAAASSGTLGALSGTAAAQAVVGAAESQTLGAVTGSAAATHPVVANASPTLGGLTETFTGTHPVTADQVKTLGVLQHTGAAAILSQMDANQTLGALTGTAAAVVAVAATSSATLGAVSPGGGSPASVLVQASASKTLGAVSPGGGSPASVLVQADAAAALGTLTGTGDATVLGAGFVSDGTLGSLQGAAQAGVTVSGAADNALNAILGVAGAVAPVAADAAQTLDPLTGFSDVSHGGAGPVADSSQTLGPLTGDGAASALTHAASAVTLGACVSSSVVPSTVYAAVRLSKPVAAVRLERRTPAAALRRPVITITV